VAGPLAVRGLLATGTLTGADGPLPPTTRAIGTATRPAITVTTKVAAPHSRRRNWPQFTQEVLASGPAERFGVQVPQLQGDAEQRSERSRSCVSE